MKKKNSILLLIVLTLVALIYFYVQKPHRNISSEKIEFNLSSDAILNEFLSNEPLALSRFLDKTIVIYGTLTEINKNFLTLDDNIYCKFDETIPDIPLNTSLKIKGRCIGFDMLLEQIKLDQCSILGQ